MPFFIRNKTKKKTGKRRKNADEDESVQQKKKPKLLKKSKDEEIQSDSDLESDLDDHVRHKAESSSDASDEETAQDKRIRLAKHYISQLEQQEADKSDDEEIDRSYISNKLKEQFLEQTGRLQKDIALNYEEPSSTDINILKGHQLSVTCIVISSDDKYAYSAGKDCSIIKWDLVNGKKVKVIPRGRKGEINASTGHTDAILSIAITTDNKYLATGDRNKLIYVWNPETLDRLKVLTGHRDVVSGLAFRKGSHQLFSSSHDRTVKIWSLDEMAYIETLFGHNDMITGIDSLTRERAITCGGRDSSVRIWKIIEESQLVFHGHSGSIDCVALINEEHFISGSDDNSLCLWSIMKKKPLCTVTNAHPGPANGTKNSEHWITAVVSLQTTDLVASGSHDGFVRLWKCGEGFKSLNLLHSVPMIGFVNCLKFTSDGLKLLVAIGREHKLGRWWKIKEAKNSVQVIQLKRTVLKQSNTNHVKIKPNVQLKSHFIT